jgi:hypothetical protein
MAELLIDEKRRRDARTLHTSDRKEDQEIRERELKEAKANQQAQDYATFRNSLIQLPVAEADAQVDFYRSNPEQFQERFGQSFKNLEVFLRQQEKKFLEGVPQEQQESQINEPIRPLPPRPESASARAQRVNTEASQENTLASRQARKLVASKAAQDRTKFIADNSNYNTAYLVPDPTTLLENGQPIGKNVYHSDVLKEIYDNPTGEIGQEAINNLVAVSNYDRELFTFTQMLDGDEPKAKAFLFKMQVQNPGLLSDLSVDIQQGNVEAARLALEIAKLQTEKFNNEREAEELLADPTRPLISKLTPPQVVAALEKDSAVKAELVKSINLAFPQAGMQFDKMKVDPNAPGGLVYDSKHQFTPETRQAFTQGLPVAYTTLLFDPLSPSAQTLFREVDENGDITGYNDPKRILPWTEADVVSSKSAEKALTAIEDWLEDNTKGFDKSKHQLRFNGIQFVSGPRGSDTKSGLDRAGAIAFISDIRRQMYDGYKVLYGTYPFLGSQTTLPGEVPAPVSPPPSVPMPVRMWDALLEQTAPNPRDKSTNPGSVTPIRSDLELQQQAIEDTISELQEEFDRLIEESTSPNE